MLGDSFLIFIKVQELVSSLKSIKLVHDLISGVFNSLHFTKITVKQIFRVFKYHEKNRENEKT